MAHAIVGMVVGEMEVSNAGIGFLLNRFAESYQVGQPLGTVVVVAFLGVANVGAVRLAEKR